MTFVSVNPCSEDQIRRVLGVLRCHLQPGTIPIILSLAALQVIMSMAATSSTDAKSSQIVIDCLKQFWPYLWSWAIDLHKNVIIDAKHVPLELHLQCKDGLIRILFTFADEQLLQSCILSTPEVVPTLVQLWRLETLDPDFALSTKTKEPYSTRFPVSEVLDSCFKALVDGSSEVWMESIIAPFGGGAKEFATIALAHFRHDMSQKQPDLEHLIHDVRLIAYSSIFSPVRYALLSLHSIRDVTKTLVRLTLRPHSDDNKLVGRSIDACFFYLIGYLEISDSTAWIIQALDAHILCAIMSCEPWLEQLHPRRINILSETLPKYLIYRSVLKAASRAITKVRDLELMARISEGGQLWKSWLQFEQLVEEGLSLMRSVCPDDIQMICNNRTVRDYVGHLVIHLKNNHAQCPTRSKQDEFRSCGGWYVRLFVQFFVVSSLPNCHSLHMFYCGASCQTYDWKFGGHRTFCKAVQANRLGDLQLLTT